MAFLRRGVGEKGRLAISTRWKCFGAAGEPPLNPVISDSREFAKINHRLGPLYFLELNGETRAEARYVNFLRANYRREYVQSAVPVQILNASRPR